MKNLNTRKMQVYKILRDYKKTRDNDLKLYLTYLREFYLISKHHEIGYVFNSILNGEIMSIESISRFRRMLQKEYPSLRGKNYHKRKKMQKQVLKDLNYKIK